MWIVTALFLIVLCLAHLAVGTSEAFRAHISELRPLTPFSHGLFLLLIVSAVCFVQRARHECHHLSTGLGAIIAVSIFAAWITPTLSLVHDLFASVPFVLLSLYVPMMLFHGERPIAALSTMIIPPLFDLVLFGSGASFGQVQKCNTLVFLALLNLLYYRILPATFPLLHSPYSEIAKPRARSVPASAVAELAIFPPIQVS